MKGVEHIIGIDLGTTNSVVSVIENGEAVIIPNAEGQPRTPSVVAFLEDGRIVVGETARRLAATQPRRTISSVKRLIGRLKQEIDEAGEVYPFDLAEDDHGMAVIVVEGKAYLPEQISALVLDKLKSAAEEYLGEPVGKAIITVPAYFDDVQRHATLRAAEMAGLKVMRLINEPTAAAMAYGLDREVTETVAIFDFGGGTFDFSILDIDNKTFEVQVSTGNSRLGGDDIDLAIVDYLADQFAQRTGFDLRADPATLRRVKDEAERAKCELSSGNAAVINLPFIAQLPSGPLHLEETLTRQKVEELIEPFVDEALACCRQGLKEAGLRKSQITKVILVGGSTRIPLLQEMVEDFFGIAPFRGVNPDEVVATGAAAQGGVMSGELDEVILLDVTPHTLSIEVKGNRKSTIIEKNSTIPIKAYKTFTTTEDDQTFVNIHLLQGEEERASDCRSLGKFMLSGIPEGRAGQPRIRVEIFVNSDGVVEVSALESHSGLEQKLVTSCTYLTADERRSQGSSTKKRRRKKSRAEEADARRRMMLGDASQTPLPRTSDTATRTGLASDFDVVDAGATPSPRPAASMPVASPQAYAEPPRAVPAPAPVPPPPPPPTISAPSAPAPVVYSPEPAAPAAWQTPAPPSPAPANLAAVDTHPPSEPAANVAAAPPPPAPESSTTERARRAEADTEARTGVHAAAAYGAPSFEPAPPIRHILELIQSGANDPDTLEFLASERDFFLEFCRQHENDPAVKAAQFRLMVLLKLPEEAREVIQTMRRAAPDDAVRLLGLIGFLCSQFPNYVAARRDRAQIAAAAGEYRLAMDDLEFVTKREESAPAVFDELTNVYERFLESHKDATIQFKLVKMYLRKGDLDDAISLLQQLVQYPDHRNRANKVMGFCFWQKGLRYLAWQKFRNLAVDEELKDVLYRLAADMERNDELVHAAHVLEKIIEVDINFRDCGDKLKKINYRIDLMQDERYGLPDAPVAETGPREKVIGDRFELLGELNRGSMGIVYRARDRILDEIVALKVLNDFLCADPMSVNRFKMEARSARRLTHQHIVRIHDFFELDHHKAISMEFIEGEDMRTVLARNLTFSEDLVRLYLAQICDAMAYAHRLGIVHRDIKPANIMIDETNSIKITDFGIAKVLNAAATKSATMIVGTPLYMAPEQIDGRNVDQRADIYSLGIMLYEMLTGNPPFYEGNIEYQHLHKAPPEMNVQVGDRMRGLVMRCIEKDPEVRYQSIDDILVELRSPEFV